MQLGKIEIRRNLISNGIYLIVNALSLFIVYKLIIDRLGKDALGIWSVLFSFLLVIINSGNAANADLTRKYLENSNKLDSVFIGRKLVNSIVVYIIYFIIYSAFIISLLAIFIPDFFKQQMGAIIIMLVGIFFGLINYSLSAILDATKLNYVKNRLSIISVLTFLIASIFLINKNLGILGISLAYFSQYLMLFGLLIFVIIKRFKPVIKYKNISKSEVQNLLESGWKLQLVALITISFDPITKYFLLQNSTLGFIAKFEIANRLINQIRTLIITSNQTLIPNLIKLNNKNSKQNILERISLNNFKILSVLFFCLALFIPLIQKFYFNTSDIQFSLICLIAMIGYGVNIMSGPYYFFFLANGLDTIPLTSHFVIGILNLIVPAFIMLTNNFWFLSYEAFGLAITSSWAFALIIGGFIIISGYFRSQKLVMAKLNHNYFRYFFIVLCSFSIISAGHRINYLNFFHMLILGFVFTLIILVLQKDIKKIIFQINKMN